MKHNLKKFKTHYEMITQIPMPDGVNLAARIWLPLKCVKSDGSFIPVSTILEYLPYRFQDGTRKRDDITYPYFASRNYAGIRVDIRGNGDSDGLMLDEYTKEELDDGCSIIAWIAQQKWSTENVGMIGVSWGGFNGLQIAFLQPPALKAVITVDSTDERYNGDIHYSGGIPLVDNILWSQQMLSLSLRPPDPNNYQGKWKNQWLYRLKNMPHLADKWLDNQYRNKYWKHASVCENYSAIKIPVLAISGWEDCYTDTVFRLNSNLTKCSTIVGPWEHSYPNIAAVTPRIDFLKIACDFWDKYLNNQKPFKSQFSAYINLPKKPSRSYKEHPGYWVKTDSPYKSNKLRMYINNHQLSETAASPTALIIDSPCHLGSTRKNYCPGMRVNEELAANQKFDDDLSLCCDSQPFSSKLTILGQVKINLQIASNQPQANIIARLCDVDENGDSQLLAWGCLNLSHRNGHEFPESMPIGQTQQIQFLLTPIGAEIGKNHRLRLALSNHYWPMLWPSPQPTRLTLDTENSFIELPLLGNHSVCQFDDAPSVSSVTVECISGPSQYRESRNFGNLFINEADDDFGEIRYCDTGMHVWEKVYEYSEVGESPLSARVRVEWERSLSRDGWVVRMKNRGEMFADGDYFYMDSSWVVYEGGEKILEDEHRHRVKRKHS